MPFSSFLDKLTFLSVIVKHNIEKLEICKDQFPEAMCDLTTMYLLCLKIPGIKWVCGKFRNTNHFWLYDTEYKMCIDFTAHQFPELVQETILVDDVVVLLGSPKEFERLGYVAWTDKRRIRECKQVLRENIRLIQKDS